MNYKIKSILITLFALMSCNAHAVSSTADAVQHRGAEVSHSRMCWKNGYVRFEHMDQGAPVVQNFDNENSKVIWLDSSKKVHIERELIAQQAVPVTAGTEKKYNPCDDLPDAESTRLKSTVLNHRQTNKWLITITVEGRDQRLFQWIDKKHRLVVRQQAENGAIDELRNIKLETVKAGMFAIPEEYRTVDSQLTALNAESSITFGTTDK